MTKQRHSYDNNDGTWWKQVLQDLLLDLLKCGGRWNVNLPQWKHTQTTCCQNSTTVNVLSGYDTLGIKEILCMIRLSGNHEKHSNHENHVWRVSSCNASRAYFLLYRTFCTEPSVQNLPYRMYTNCKTPTKEKTVSVKSLSSKNLN